MSVVDWDLDQLVEETLLVSGVVRVNSTYLVVKSHGNFAATRTLVGRCLCSLAVVSRHSLL